jgi:phospho-N-acetylmuramoyl-pentapeptide-transferase
MEQILGLVLISFTLTALLIVPFIDFLFHLKSKYKIIDKKAISLDTPIHNHLLKDKDKDSPSGGGLIIIPVVVLLSTIILLFLGKGDLRELFILIFSLLAFGCIGLVDDIRKIFVVFSGKYAGLRGRYLFSFQLFFSFIIATVLYFQFGLNNIFVPIFGNIILGWWYIPLATFIIVSFTNAFNISDGLDGLSTGLLTICLFAFLVLAHTVFDTTMSVFVGVWIGALIAYLYFNVFPARIILGDAGGFGFGATLAVVGLLSGKIFGLGVIGGIYVIIVASSFIQIFSKRVFKKKVFPVAPIHMYFKYIGWEEPKIVFRFWLAGAIFAILGLWLALLSK